MSTSITAYVHVYPDTKVDAYWQENSRVAVVRVGDLSVFLRDLETADTLVAAAIAARHMLDLNLPEYLK